MSDLYYVRIGEVEGARVVLHCMTGFTADGTNYETSRSFAFSVILEAKTRVGDYEYLASHAPVEARRQLQEIATRVENAPSPLHESLPNSETWEDWEASWHKLHMPKFVASTKLLARHNVRPPDEASAVMSEVSELGHTWYLIEAGWERLHCWDLEVTLTDAKYAAHLIEGHLFATASFDAWDEQDQALDVEAEDG